MFKEFCDKKNCDEKEKNMKKNVLTKKNYKLICVIKVCDNILCDKNFFCGICIKAIEYNVMNSSPTLLKDSIVQCYRTVFSGEL